MKEDLGRFLLTPYSKNKVHQSLCTVISMSSQSCPVNKFQFHIKHSNATVHPNPLAQPTKGRKRPDHEYLLTLSKNSYNRLSLFEVYTLPFCHLRVLYPPIEFTEGHIQNLSSCKGLWTKVPTQVQTLYFGHIIYR